jgi:Bacterial pre-peptidase C-terminal domain
MEDSSMKLRFLTALALLAAGCLVVGAQIGAGEKKDNEKKPDELVINDELINADLKDKVLKESLCKNYTHKLTAGKTYLIDMKSRAFNSFLRLEDPEGTQVAEDDNSGGMQDARIVFRAPKTGDYSIVATSVGESMGKFTLTVKELIIPSVALKLEKGQATHNGNLAKTDFRFRGQKPHKLYTIEMEAGKTYQIDQLSRAFDAYLYLEDPDGAIVGEDDDSGGNLNARIIYKAAKAGKYHIVATTYDGRTGAFTLTVRQTGGDPPREDKKKD